MKYIFIIFLIIPNLVFASGNEGAHHGSITDLIPPYINFLLLMVPLVLILRKKLSSFFIEQERETSELIERADSKYKEAQMRLELFERKLEKIDDEISHIESDAGKDLANFNQSVLRQTEATIQKIRHDTQSKVESEKNHRVRAINNLFIDNVILNAKKIIGDNGNFKKKASEKLLREIR